MGLDVMNPTSKFIEGVVEECFRQGLTEKQASIVLEHAVYRAQEFTKQASDDPVNSGRARSLLKKLLHSVWTDPGSENPLRMVEEHRDYRGPSNALNAFNEYEALNSSYRNASRIAYKTLRDEYKAAGKPINTPEFQNRLLESTRKTFIARHLQNSRRNMELAEEAMRNAVPGTELYAQRLDRYNEANRAYDAARHRLATQLDALYDGSNLPTALRGIKGANGQLINTVDEFRKYYKQVKNEVAARDSIEFLDNPFQWLIARTGIGYTDEELREAEQTMRRIEQHEAGKQALKDLGITSSVVDNMTGQLRTQDEARDALREAAARERRSNRNNTQAQGSNTPQPARTPSSPAPSTPQAGRQTPRWWSDMSVLDMARAFNPSTSTSALTATPVYSTY